MSSPSRASALAALGLRLARSGPLAIASLAIGAVTTFGMIVAAFVIAAHGGRALAQLPSVAAWLLAWGAGVLLAFGASAQALRRDRDDGVRTLVLARGGPTRAYLWARIAGLVVLLALVVVGGTALTGGVSLALASHTTAARVARGAGAAIAYAVAFCVVVAPVALAALGARTRAGGYGALVFVLILPELFEGWTAEIVPRGWSQLVSIPAALGAIKSALVPAFDAAKLIRAAVVLGAVVVIALAVVRQQIARVDAEARK